MTEKVRVRFAPSPTGNMHIGGLRTALFNWLFARHAAGTFLVRIEDTDKERSEEKYVQALFEALAWVGIESDEPVIFQSQRQKDYHEVVNKLILEKKAYRCFCTPKDLEDRVRKAGITDEHYSYDGFCRNRVIKEQETDLYGIRFSIPESVTEIKVNDLIRGTVTFDRNQLDDFIIFRSDGTPMYNFAVVIDDAYSRITHIIRGEEHLSNTPKQILLYEACGYKIPQFAHIPMILAPDGSKLSKRYGAVDVLSYRQSGYLPDALINYIARLGWSFGDQEQFSKQELIAHFTLEGVGKKGAIFDIQKLEWLNGVYVRNVTQADLMVAIEKTDAALHFQTLAQNYSLEKISEALRLYQPRVKTVVQLAQEVIELFKQPAFYKQDEILHHIHKDQTEFLLEKAVHLLMTIDTFSLIEISSVLKSLCEEESIKLVSLAQPLRIALTGGVTSPGVFELLALLGKEESCARIKAFLIFLDHEKKS